MIADKHTGCKFTIASAGSITPHDSIAVFMKTHQNSARAITLTAACTDSSSVAVITYRAHHGEVNSSLDCQVDSLEVYRGRQKVTEISHGGISINMNGSIKVIPWFTSLLMIIVNK